MSGWVHVEHRAGQGKVCYAAVQTGETPTPCGCQTPTPDPASPCALEWCQHRGAYWWHTALRVGGDHDQWDRLHPHRPTRCTCGHPIEERA